MLMPAARIIMYSAECTVGQIAHKSSENCRLSETGKVRTPELLPESRLQNGSPIVIMGPKLPLSPSSLSQPWIGLSTTRVSRRFDSGVPLEGRTTASTNVFTPTSGGASTSANCTLWLPSLLSSSLWTVHPRGTEAAGTNPVHSAELHGCRVGC